MYVLYILCVCMYCIYCVYVCAVYTVCMYVLYILCVCMYCIYCVYVCTVYTVCMYVAWDSVWSLYSPDWTYRRGFVNMLDSAPAVDMVTSTGRDIYVCMYAYVCLYINCMYVYYVDDCTYIFKLKMCILSTLLRCFI